jgi:hypothetical protein
MVNTFYVLNMFVWMPNCCYTSAYEYNEGTISRNGYFFENPEIVCFVTICMGADSYKKSSKYPSRVIIPFRLCTEAEFLDVIGTKVWRVFLLAIHSPHY